MSKGRSSHTFRVDGRTFTVLAIKEAKSITSHYHVDTRWSGPGEFGGRRNWSLAARDELSAYTRFKKLIEDKGGTLA